MFFFQLPSERLSHRPSRFLSKVALVDNIFYHVCYSRVILCVLLSLRKYFHCLGLFYIVFCYHFDGE